MGWWKTTNSVIYHFQGWCKILRTGLIFFQFQLQPKIWQKTGCQAKMRHVILMFSNFIISFPCFLFNMLSWSNHAEKITWIWIMINKLEHANCKQQDTTTPLRIVGPSKIEGVGKRWFDGDLKKKKHLKQIQTWCISWYHQTSEPKPIGSILVSFWIYLTIHVHGEKFCRQTIGGTTIHQTTWTDPKGPKQIQEISSSLLGQNLKSSDFSMRFNRSCPVGKNRSSMGSPVLGKIPKISP